MPNLPEVRIIVSNYAPFLGTAQPNRLKLLEVPGPLGTQVDYINQKSEKKISSKKTNPQNIIFIELKSM